MRRKGTKGAPVARSNRRRFEKPRARKPGKMAQRPAPPCELPNEREGLTLVEYEFALAYLGNGFNARQAYLSGHPAALPSTAGVEGWRYLNNPNVRAFLNRRLEERWKPLEMAAAEAVGRISQIARADIRELLDEKGVLKRPELWPESIRGCVRAIKPGPAGDGVTIESPLAALRIILELTGRLKNPIADAADALADAIKRDMARREGKQE